MDFEETRRLYSGLIKKPPLTDQLLSRPPFKFLLDVFSGVINNTGYLKDQFSPSDLDAKLLSDKTAKVNFLEKIISSVDSGGSLKSVKGAKIVAGKEPENTILLLNKFATEAARFRDGSASSNKENKKKERPSREKTEDREKVKERKSSKSKDPATEKREPSKSKEREREKSRSKDKEMNGKSEKDDKKERSSSKKERSSSKEKKKSSSSKEVKEKKVKKEKSSSKKEKKSEEVSKKSPRLSPSTSLLKVSADNQVHSPVETNNEPEDDASVTAKADDSGVGDMESPRPLPASLRENARLGTSAGRPMTSLGRPGTAAARPAPPKLKKKQIAEVVERPVVVPDDGPEIIVDNSETEKEDNFIVEEQEPEADRVDNALPDPDAEHGGLVAKIMETREQIQSGFKEEIVEEDENEQSAQKHLVDGMQNTIQKVTQTAFPLARVFNFAQEDMESMIKELEKWRNETRRNEQLLRDRDADDVGDSQRLAATLTQLEDAIRETRQKLQSVKAKVVANEEQIKIMASNM